MSVRGRWFAIASSCLVGVAAVGVTACGGGGGGGSTSANVSGSTLTIYSSLPLQGSTGPNSQSAINGAKLALKAVNGKVGKYTIKYVSLDDSTATAGKWDPGQVSTDARKAAQDKSTIAYIGEFNSGASAISIPILNQAGIGQISPTNTAVGLTSNVAGRRAWRASEVLPDGQAHLRACRPEGHDPGRRSRDGHEAARLRQAVHRERQGGVRRRAWPRTPWPRSRRPESRRSATTAGTRRRRTTAPSRRRSSQQGRGLLPARAASSTTTACS